MMDPREGEFVDRMGLVMERFGGTRTMGRLYAWLLICDPPHQSLTELAARLGVSKTAVSTVARQLELTGMIERVPTASREHRYQVAAGGWEHVLKVQLAALRQALEAVDLGLAAVAGGGPEQRARLEETRDFFAWTERDADDMLRRWHASREDPDR